jgi:hypothetical protein
MQTLGHDQLTHRRLLLRTEGACEFDPEHLLDVFGKQRQRFVAVLRGFGPSDWAAPTRCTDWSVHDVIRHLCDGNMKLAAAGLDDRTLDLTAGFDPRTTPRGWPTISASESPAPPSAVSWQRPTNCSSWRATGWPTATRSTSACRTGPWTGRSSCSTHSGIRGFTSATYCWPGTANTPPTATQPATRPRTACSSQPPWRRCLAGRYGRS